MHKQTVQSRESGFVPHPREASPPPDANAQGGDLRKRLRQLEVDLILEALRRSNGHQRRAACWLGVSATNLNARMKRLGIAVERVLTYADGERQDRIAAGHHDLDEDAVRES